MVSAGQLKRSPHHQHGRGPRAMHVLLAANLLVMLALLVRSFDVGGEDLTSPYFRSMWENCAGSVNKVNNSGPALDAASAVVDAGEAGAHAPSLGTEAAGNSERDFLPIAERTGTDKVLGVKFLPNCVDPKSRGLGCLRPEEENPLCRPYGHFYHTMYNRWLGKYSSDVADPIQFLEIGFSDGKSFEAYTEFLPNAEAHSMEISCKDAAKNEKWYQTLLDRKRLHCGDASDVSFLDHVWKTEMKRDDAPPLKVVIDDASHVAMHMVQTVFYWFPKIAPGGVLIVEDIAPTPQANQFRTQFLPQMMADLHYCGGKGDVDGLGSELCFPTLQPLLHSIHCELHICTFERNGNPATDLGADASKVPPNALDRSMCKTL